MFTTAKEEVQYLLNRRGCDVLVNFVPGEDDQVDDASVAKPKIEQAIEGRYEESSMFKRP